MNSRCLKSSYLPGKLQVAPCKPPPCVLACCQRPRSRDSFVANAQKVDANQRRETGASQNGAAPAGAECVTEEDFYPKYEDSNGDDEFLPRRQPGTFPNIKVSKSGWQAALTKLQSFAAAPGDASPAEAEVKEFDPLRDGPLRYLGYANECGEAFAAWLPLWGVPFSYAVAIGYVLTDTADKGTKAYQTSQAELSANQSLHQEVDMPRLVRLLAFERALDTIVWQLLASVACPGYTIHTVVALVHSVIKPLEETAPMQQLASTAAAGLHLQAADILALVEKSFPTAMGLAAIPFIVHPIDNGIHALMNMTLRPAMQKYVCGPGQGNLAGLQMCSDEECIPADASAASGNGSQNGSR